MSMQRGRWSKKPKSCQRSLWTTPKGIICICGQYTVVASAVALIFQTLLYKVHSYSQASSNPDRTCHLCTADFFKKNVIILHYVLHSPKNAKKKFISSPKWWNWTDVLVLSLIHILNSTTNVASPCGILFVTLMVNKDEWILDNVWLIKFRSKNSTVLYC